MESCASLRNSKCRMLTHKRNVAPDMLRKVKTETKGVFYSTYWHYGESHEGWVEHNLKAENQGIRRVKRIMKTYKYIKSKKIPTNLFVVTFVRDSLPQVVNVGRKQCQIRPYRARHEKL